MTKQLHHEWAHADQRLRPYRDHTGLRCYSAGGVFRRQHEFDKDSRCVWCDWLQPPCVDGSNDHRREGGDYPGPRCTRCQRRVQATKTSFDKEQNK